MEVTDKMSNDLNEAIAVYMKIVKEFKAIAGKQISDAIDTLKKCLRRNPQYSDQIGDIVAALEQNKNDFRSAVEDVYGACGTVSSLLNAYFEHLEKADSGSAVQLRTMLISEPFTKLANSLLESNEKLKAIRIVSSGLSGELNRLQGEISDDKNYSDHSTRNMICGVLAIIGGICSGIGTYYFIVAPIGLAAGAASTVILLAGGVLGVKKGVEEANHIDAHKYIDGKVKAFNTLIGDVIMATKDIESKAKSTKILKDFLPADGLQGMAKGVMMLCDAYVKLVRDNDELRI